MAACALLANVKPHPKVIIKRLSKKMFVFGSFVIRDDIRRKEKIMNRSKAA
jgi:hypothetical protein